MIIVPEIETVVILVPRTGTSALKRALLNTYPKAMQLYRHMEADGVPYGYDHWRRVGVLREPVTRLWSLYRFLKWMGADREPDGQGKWEPAYVERQRNSVARSFNDWIVHNDVVFTGPYDVRHTQYYPGFAVHHLLPETRKSQFIYLRPDLGTEVVPFEQLDRLHQSLGIVAPCENHNKPQPVPALTEAAEDHVQRWLSWDIETHKKFLQPLDAPGSSGL